MSLIDTYQLATGGQNLRDTYTLASNGILIRVDIDDLPPVYDTGIGGGIIPGQEWPPKEDIKKITRKKITVTAIVGGIEYKESIIVEDMPNLSIKDIDVNVVETDVKPKITISITK
jgi:hypothetical protein